MRHQHQVDKKSVGMTLVELLIVTVVMLLLASLALSALKGLLRGQKVAQAAVTVKQYLQNAQIRAMASGRPVAVFLDRVSMTGNSGKATEQNYTVTRLQFGEMFPAYSGDVASVKGTLREIDYTSTFPDTNNNFATTRGGFDLRADQIAFNLADVAAAFGAGDSDVSGNLGFVKPGDFIEFTSFPGRFVIERYKLDPNNSSIVLVQFFNPPPTYSLARRMKGSGRHLIYEAIDASAVPPIALTPGLLVEFKIYRQPTRSLVGSLVLPRGTCIDLSVSGVGVSDNCVDAGRFDLKTLPPNTVSRGDFSRIGLVFGPEGRLLYMLDEDSSRTLTPRIALSADSLVYLLVGRTDQVLPGFNGSNGKSQAFQHDDPDINPSGAAELPKANLVDPENVWITCNPATGEIRTAPMAALSPADITNGLSASKIGMQVRLSRTWASAGMSNKE